MELYNFISLVCFNVGLFCLEVIFLSKYEVGYKCCSILYIL